MTDKMVPLRALLDERRRHKATKQKLQEYIPMAKYVQSYNLPSEQIDNVIEYIRFLSTELGESIRQE